MNYFDLKTFRLEKRDEGYTVCCDGFDLTPSWVDTWYYGTDGQWIHPVDFCFDYDKIQFFQTQEEAEQQLERIKLILNQEVCQAELRDAG